MKKICILNYGSGNVKSVFNLANYLGYDTVISNKKDDITEATHIILPGVGSFGSAMKKINSLLPIKFLSEEVLLRKKPFLGICVGMQVLVEKGLEHGEHKGLGWIKGEVSKLAVNSVPLPHIGWNDIETVNESPLFSGLGTIKDFYFVHSYALTTEQENITTETNYEINFCSSIRVENVFGVQFHPEKSQKAGLLVINNFLGL